MCAGGFAQILNNSDRRLRRPRHHGPGREGLIRPWQEKRGEVEPEALSGNPIVQVGLVTEDLNRQWYERNTWDAPKNIQCRVRQPVIRWMAATFDYIVAGTGALAADFHAFLRLRNRTPAPPPFSSINSTPAASSAFCNFDRASKDTGGPKLPSRRLTVGSESPARVASSV
jgi:hypothetical protein